MHQRIHETVAGFHLQQEGKGAGRGIEVGQQNFLFRVEPLDLKSQIASQSAGPTGGLAGHDAVDFSQLARLDVGVQLVALEPVEGGADLFQDERLEQELAGSLA